jgi:hypothetical protein
MSSNKQNFFTILESLLLKKEKGILTNSEKVQLTNKTLILVKKAFEVINNRFINLTADHLKKLYKGFYSGYIELMSDQQISEEVKIDLVAKKIIIDEKLNEINKKNTPLNELNVLKSVSNRIQSKRIQNKLNSNLAKYLSELNLNPAKNK